jgi:hypothetical protein
MNVAIRALCGAALGVLAGAYILLMMFVLAPIIAIACIPVMVAKAIRPEPSLRDQLADALRDIEDPNP